MKSVLDDNIFFFNNHSSSITKKLFDIFFFLSGTNDAFVTIALGKEKYQTSVKEKATESVDWCEQCEL